MKEFIRKASEHQACEGQMKGSRKGFWIGILYMISSWQLIALGISTHALLMDSWLARYIDFSVQMFLGTIALFLASIIFHGFIKGKGIKEGWQQLKITRKNDIVKEDQVRYLSYAGRIGTIYTRAAFATFGYFLFELARVYIGVIDNSALHGADALVYACMFGWWVKPKADDARVYTNFEWRGMAISASAILFAFFYEWMTKSLVLASGGVAEGVGSAVMLSCVILISSIAVHHDSVIRIAFHNCLFGFLASCIMIIINICVNYDGGFSEIIKVLRILNLKSTAWVSLSYAGALIGFLTSYKYIKPVLIAMLGNSLGLGTVVMTFFFHSGEVNSKDIAITVILTIGSIILGIEEWKKKNEKSNQISR